MFTGIIVETGTVRRATPKGESMRLEISARKALDGAKEGASIAVDGVCLTVTQFGPDWFRADVGEETWRRTTLSGAVPGRKVNLEPSLKLGDSMGGHQVMGHVDGLGNVTGRRSEQTQEIFEIEAPRELVFGIAAKGSIAVDGISLTVGKTQGARFELYVIPTTLAVTALGEKGIGDRVNLEVDVVARYLRASLLDLLEGEGGRDVALLEKLKRFGYAG